MIKYDRFTLDNGLSVVVHEDPTTPLVAVNTLYDVGARDEDESRTGFAHLFEHLMFEGSVNVPNFDEPLQRAGGESNAFTNNDITNYYDIVPAGNIETVFWLESDRMLHLDINEESLDVQRKVVSEEFKEHYLNQPYGDVWHKISSLAYKVHPYKWPTIGKELSHVENATLGDVTAFFDKFYVPSNAVMVVAGNITTAKTKELVTKWFADIPNAPKPKRNLPKEPKQTEARKLDVHADVPTNGIYMAFHMGDRLSHNYYVIELLTDLLANGNSSRLYHRLVKEQELFTELDAYMSGYFDAGIVLVEGKLNNGVTMQQAEHAIHTELEKTMNTLVEANELQKIKNKQESTTIFSEVNLLTRATNLAYYELLGNTELINSELEIYNKITSEELMEEARKVFVPENCSTLYYHANQS